MVCLSIYLCRLWFLSSVSYSFQSTGSFVSLGRFTPRYFILLDVMVNGIASLISLSDLSLLVYRNAVDFCVLILYPVTLPNSWMSSNSFLIESLGFFLGVVSCHLQIVIVLLLPFQFGFLLFLFLPDCPGKDFQDYVEE